MYCTACGQQMNDDQQFCPNCGAFKSVHSQDKEKEEKYQYILSRINQVKKRKDAEELLEIIEQIKNYKDTQKMYDYLSECIYKFEKEERIASKKRKKRIIFAVVIAILFSIFGLVKLNNRRIEKGVDSVCQLIRKEKFTAEKIRDQHLAKSLEDEECIKEVCDKLSEYKQNNEFGKACKLIYEVGMVKPDFFTYRYCILSYSFGSWLSNNAQYYSYWSSSQYTNNPATNQSNVATYRLEDYGFVIGKDSDYNVTSMYLAYKHEGSVSLSFSSIGHNGDNIVE